MSRHSTTPETPPSGRGRRRATRATAGCAALATAVAGMVAAGPATSAAAAPPPPPTDAHGIDVVDWAAVPGIPGLHDATVETGAAFEPIHVRIDLPAGYDPARSQPYEVLYLTHGAGENAASWSDPAKGDASAVVAASSFDGIVVMPEAGNAGWYVDWVAPTPGGFQPDWETFHVDQLLPWVAANFNTTGTGAGRAVAGLSMGGFGALSYAGRHPDEFSAVGSFSGVTDITDLLIQQVAIANSVTMTEGVTIGGPDRACGLLESCPYFADDVQDVFGPYGTWSDRNPTDLAADQAYATYDGDLAVYNGGAGLDAALVPTTDAFHAALDDAGVTHRYCSGEGTDSGHTWANWRGTLADFLETTYGTAPATCPHDWGPPTP